MIHLRISLMVVLLAGIAAIAITHFAVRPKINGLISARDGMQVERDQQKARADKLATANSELQQEVVEKNGRIHAATEQLSLAQAESAVLREKSSRVGRSLEEANRNLSVAQQQLAQLAVLGLTAEQAAGLYKSNQVLVSRIANLQAEREKLAQDYRLLDKQWRAVFSDPEWVPALPPVSGKVVAVDPKYGFVVLDMGAEHGLVPKGVLMISRGSRLIAKARLTRVEADRSVADVLPGWNLEQVQEGDRAFN